MEVSNYLVSWFITYLGDLQPTSIGVIIQLLSTSKYHGHLISLHTSLIQLQVEPRSSFRSWQSSIEASDLRIDHLQTGKTCTWESELWVFTGKKWYDTFFSVASHDIYWLKFDDGQHSGENWILTNYARECTENKTCWVQVYFPKKKNLPLNQQRRILEPPKADY